MPLVKKRNVPGAPKKWAWNYRKPSKCKTRCLQAGVFLSLGKTGMLHGCKARNFNWLRCFSAINSRLKYTYRMKIKPKIWKTFRRYFFWLVIRVGVSKKKQTWRRGLHERVSSIFEALINEKFMGANYGGSLLNGSKAIDLLWLV